MAKLSDRCIWITGASSGMGKALANTLCDMGNFVIVSARSKDVLQQMVLTASGRMSAVPMDFGAEGEQLAGYAERLAEVTDYIDIVICCAGVCEYEDGLRFDPTMYQRAVDINFMGVVKALNLAMPLLQKAVYTPQFVAVGSLSSVLPLPRAQAYGASKAALAYFMGALRADLANTPLRTTLVRPGFVKTKMTANNDFAMPFILDVESAAQIIINGIARRRTVIDFPRRLSWPMRLLGLCSAIWYRGLAPRVSRITSEAWKTK